jgi:hypothetical protein
MVVIGFFYEESGRDSMRQGFFEKHGEHGGHGELGEIYRL